MPGDSTARRDRSPATRVDAGPQRRSEIVYLAAPTDVVVASTAGNHRGFHGLEADATIGLVYARNRWYDPALSRFVSADPLGYVDGPNLYQYALNNPIVFSDPLGLQTDPELTEILARVQGAADEAARRHGINSWSVVLSSGEKGTAVHKTMQELLAPGGEFHHPRILTEVEVGKYGAVLGYGKKGFADKGSLVKDVVILKPGLDQTKVPRLVTQAKDVTLMVIDLKIGRYGAPLRQAETLKRFGVTSVRHSPFNKLADEIATAASRLKVARRIRGVPVLGTLALGMTAMEAKAAAESGDLDRAMQVITGVDLLIDAADAAGQGVQDHVRRRAEQMGLMPDQRREALGAAYSEH